MVLPSKTIEHHGFLPWNIVGLYIHFPSNKAMHWFCLQHFAAGVEGARSFCSSLCSLKQILQRQSSWNKQKRGSCSWLLFPDSLTATKAIVKVQTPTRNFCGSTVPGAASSCFVTTACPTLGKERSPILGRANQHDKVAFFDLSSWVHPKLSNIFFANHVGKTMP